MKKRYLYMVSYAHKNGFGNARMAMRKKITTEADMSVLHRLVAEANNEDFVVIISLFYLGRTLATGLCAENF